MVICQSCGKCRLCGLMLNVNFVFECENTVCEAENCNCQSLRCSAFTGYMAFITFYMWCAKNIFESLVYILMSISYKVLNVDRKVY